MPKTLIAGTLYLITVEQGDYYTHATPFRLYATRAKADRFMNRLKLHYSRKPATPLHPQDDEVHEEWYAKLLAWQVKHPGGKDNSTTPAMTNRANEEESWLWWLPLGFGMY